MGKDKREMKDGFYLSVYSNISELACLINVGLRDNHNMSLWKKSGSQIALIRYWEFERLSGFKQHKMSFYNVEHAKSVINDLLSEYSLTIDDMEEVIGTPGLATCDDYSSLSEFPDYTYHSIAHLFSGIMMDTNMFYNENMIAIAADGGPDNIVDIDGRTKNFYCGIISKKGNVRTIPVDSPGPLWIFMKYRYSMQEGSLMALGSASNSEFYFSIDECMQDFPSIRRIQDINISFSWFEKLAEKIESVTKEDVGVLFNYFDERFSEEENKISMVAKIIQDISKRIMEENVESLLAEGDLEAKNTYLTLVGGYALNCPTNAHLVDKYKFKGFVAPPCVSDTGMSLGMALYYFRKNEKIDFRLQSAYWGFKESDENIDSLIESDEFKKFIKSVTPYNVKKVVEDIKEFPIIWFDGQSEIGPRALGNRSILGDPSNIAQKDILNNIKQRQWWRPVAPIVIEDLQEDWFENTYSSPFMLMAVNIKKNKTEEVSAVRHLDNTARIQTIRNCKENAVLYNVVNEFYKETGIPMVCNTSLNDKGEPIIDKAGEALNFALRKRIPIIYLNHTRIELHNFDDYLEKSPAKRSDAFVYKLTDEEKQKRLDELNPFKLSRSQIILYLNNPELFVYDLKDEAHVKKLLRIFRHMPNLPFQ